MASLMSSGLMSSVNRRLAGHNRIVVKIGSALLVEKGELKKDWLDALISDVVDLARGGAEMLIVSSGSIALGRGILGLPSGPLKLEESQAAAAAGQIALAKARPQDATMSATRLQLK